MLEIYNTFTHQKEPFVSIVPGNISLYVCGITVYDFCHLGHARVFVAFDVIVRYLRSTGWKVHYVRNITDVDDKIIQRAQQNNETIQVLTDRFIKAMNEDAKALNVLPPDEEPRATQHIDKIIEMVQTLIAKDYAYVANNGDVYFKVDHYDSYGKLAHKDLEQLQSGARVEINEQKHSALDFVLWKKAKSGEPSWPSPWGEGRPGWHIECSAMSVASLGNPFDIHGGGADLAFPHHENERAQSECATGKKFVNTWMHVGFIQINKEKMSKSLNNFFTIRDILKEYDAEVVRYFLLASHYRSPVNFSKEQLEQAKNALERLYTALRGISLPTERVVTPAAFYIQRFTDAMNDDFNTPIALSVIFECAHALNSAREKGEVDKQFELAATLKYCGNILGVLERSPDEFLQGDEQDISKIKNLIADRENARSSKEWARADEIRQMLTAMGIALEDKPEGTIWRKI